MRYRIVSADVEISKVNQSDIKVKQAALTCTKRNFVRVYIQTKSYWQKHNLKAFKQFL